MTSDQLLDLWAKAQKLSGATTPRSHIDLKIFAVLVQEYEREACATICEDYEDGPFCTHAALIRARASL